MVEYEGTEFYGWATQPGLRTVEDELARALETILRHPVRLTVAGRTDAGVHASGQVISFDVETGLTPAEIAYRTTAVLPSDVALRRCVEASEGFDARRCAKSRTYEYRILNSPVRSPLGRRRAVHVSKPLDFETLTEAALLLEGTHDFRAFTPAKAHHTRFEREVFESLWERQGEMLAYRITANAFLYGMVRALVGTMLEVAEGRRSLESLERLLYGAPRSQAGPTAPARGLTLTGVEYEGIRL
jgi:tRNA pseudouridine38-40 synthase